MKNIFALIYCLAIFSFIFQLSACSADNSNNKKTEKSAYETSPIIGKWKMVQPNSDGASDLVLIFEKTGFFEENTILNDPKFAAAGIDKIQPIAKGQWKLSDKNLIIEKYINQDSVKNEKFEINFIGTEKITLKNQKNKKITFIKYIEK